MICTNRIRRFFKPFNPFTWTNDERWGEDFIKQTIKSKQINATPQENIKYPTLYNMEYETIYGLSNNIDYLYRVSTINDSGESAYAFVRSAGNSLLDEEVDEAIKDVLSNWDFGSILFTGVCTV